MFDRFRLPAEAELKAAGAVAPATRRVDLDVPYAEKDEAKRLGARWDPVNRCWYLPEGLDPAPFLRWSPAAAAVVSCGPTVRARLLALPDTCYRCRRRTRSVVGVLVPAELTDDPEGFVPFAELADVLAVRLDRDRLAALGVGELRRRWSGVVGRSYLSNGCSNCGAIQGNFPLHDALLAYRAEGGGYDALVVTDVDIPMDILSAGEDDLEA